MSKSTINNGDTGASVRTALNAMFGELYTAGFAFKAVATITAAAAGTAAHVLPAATVTGSQKAYITGILINVNGATAWTDLTATVLKIQDTAGSPVVGITIPKALLLGNAIIDTFSLATITISNNILRGTGFTAAKGLDIVADANFAAGSDIYVTITGYIA